MAILMFATDYKPLCGGIATVSYELTKALSKKDDIVVLAPDRAGASEFDRAQGFKTIRAINILGTASLIYPFIFPFIISRYRIRRVLCTVWFPSAIITMFWSFILGLQYLVMAHGSDFLDDKITLRRRVKSYLSILKILSFKKAKKVLTPSLFSRGRLIAMGISPKKIALLRDGADPIKFNPDISSDDIKRRYGLYGKRILLTVARLDEHKGHDMVIRALPEIVKEFSGVKYLIVGSGPYERALRELVKKLSLNEFVIFAGKVDEKDLPAIYCACDIFIMPSRRVMGRNDLLEGFGISYMEANACGKSVIGGRSGGVPDAVIDGQTGILVDPTSVDEVKDAILILLRDKELARRLGENGRKRVVEELNWQKIADEIMKLIEE